MSLTQTLRLIARFVAACTVLGLFAPLTRLSAQAVPSRSDGSTDIGISYSAARSLRAGSTQNFWMQGGSVEAGKAMWHGLGPAVNVTGGTTGAIGASTVPLSLITFTVGPRFRFHEKRSVSAYGEVLFGVAHGFNSVFPSQGSSMNRANSFALSTGGGVDVRLRGAIFVRAVDVNYLRTSLPNGTNNLQNTLRIGAGIGIRLGGR